MVNSLDESMDREEDSIMQQKAVPTIDPLEEIKNLIRAEPEINAARVMFLKAEIEAGKYTINSEAIAAKMLGNL
jgi:flagellar biosynthesis anti-sigma factor FlgM